MSADDKSTISPLEYGISSAIIFFPFITEFPFFAQALMQWTLGDITVSDKTPSVADTLQTLEARDLWYFIYDDFYRGVGAGVGLLIAAIFLILLRKQLKHSMLMTISMLILFYSQAVISAIFIYAQCTSFFDLKRHQSPWPDFHSYPSAYSIGDGIPFLVVLLLLFMSYRKKRMKPESLVT